MEAHKRYYAFDICPGFWNSLVALSLQGKVMNIDKVLEEIKEQQDALRDWASSDACQSFFMPSGEQRAVEAYQRIIHWVHAYPQFTSAAKADFARKADGWLVAYGLVHGFTVVTDEVFDPNVKRRVPIPNVCDALNIPYVNTFDMLRALRVTFT